MSFVVYSDGSCNLPKSQLDGIQLLPCSYSIDDVHYSYDGDIDHFDGVSFYNQLKEGKSVKTTLLNSALFEETFEPVLKEGKDIVYISMSSGISGTYNACRIAKEELLEKYKNRKIVIIDSLGCGFGSGLLAIKAAELSKENVSIDEAETVLNDMVPHTCQYFTVDDLNFLKRTGRVTGATAAIATILNIKPILYGDDTGHIVSAGKVKGRRASIDALVKKYAEKSMDADKNIVFISHGDCLEDAQSLADKIKEVNNPKEIIISMHEPFSGAHVGPGMLGLFFIGKQR